VYIDESGDIGIHLSREGTSRHFTIAAIIVQSDQDLERCRAGLLAFRSRRGLKRAEFGFNQCDRRLRSEYLAAASALPWSFLSLSIDKAELDAPRTAAGFDLYLFAVTLLLGSARPHPRQATVIFDSCGGVEFRRAITSCCKAASRQPDGTIEIKRVLAQRSHSDQLLQLADMVVGSVARAQRPELTDSRTCLQLIRSHQLATIDWPVDRQK